MYLSIDPGGVSGYAYFDETGDMKVMGQINNGLDGMSDFLSAFERPVGVVIVEDYRIRGNPSGLKANVGSRVETIQVIGLIKGWARGSKIKFVLQDASIKKIAEMYSGVKPPKNHRWSHQVDAMNHGYYYLVRHHIITPEGAGGRTIIND